MMVELGESLRDLDLKYFNSVMVQIPEAPLLVETSKFLMFRFFTDELRYEIISSPEYSQVTLINPSSKEISTPWAAHLLKQC